jgi:hypothetical protein
MKASELRIGNLVDLGNRIAKVIEINHLACVVVDLEETQDTIEDYERTKPIPLTEEWLVNFGFDKLPIVFESKKFYLYKQDNSDIWRLNHSGTNAHITTLKYVHQLQNLYFALTGEELVVKE